MSCCCSFYRSRVRIVLALREMRNPPCWKNLCPLRSEQYSHIIYCIVCWSLWFSEHILVILHECKPHCLIVHVITFLPAQHSTPKRRNGRIKHNNSTLNFNTHSWYYRIQFVELLPCTIFVFAYLNTKTCLGGLPYFPKETCIIWKLSHHVGYNIILLEAVVFSNAYLSVGCRLLIFPI